MAESLDFQINDLKFRAAISDKFPYQRATAPFRKEQFDSAPTVGDQSLSGWWTRGQLSFHKGAGLKYYEVLEGEAILDRFRDSLGVKPFTPGEVTLTTTLSDYADTVTLGTDLQWAAGVTDIAGNATVAYIAGDTPAVLYSAKPGNAAITYSMVDGTAPKKACAAPSRNCVFVATTGKSIERHVHNGGSQQLYTHSEDLVAIFFEKERIWFVDAQGDLYAVPPAPTTMPTAVASSDKVGPLGKASALASMAATPGLVYLSDGTSTIYQVGLDPDGSVPTVQTPIVAATLPEGETVRFVQAHLGMVVIGTDLGVRVAMVGQSGGLTYGSLHETGPCGRQSTIQGTSVWFIAGVGAGASGSGNNYLTELDLANEVGDLLFAWARRAAVGPSGYLGAIVVDGDIGYFKGTDQTLTDVSEIKTARTDTLEPSGTLTTAFHRFGTLDAKHFQEVLVRSDGTGSIEVYRGDGDGTETSLGVMDASTRQAVFPVGLDDPVERIALRFVLTRNPADSTLGPEFLGYQIKALPSPKRQRLIKWPLLITDTYKDRHGATHGARDGAWPAWETLETLEESDALVTYTDHRTGETGEAYIESLELQTDTPSKGASTGFGGIGYITLRKVG